MVTESRQRLQEKLTDSKAVLRRYPRLCAHIICTSLGYATPTTAASILRAYIHDKEHYCEWISACYGCNPKPAVECTYNGRHYHRGYMAEYRRAYALVRRANATGDEPILASWF